MDDGEVKIEATYTRRDRNRCLYFNTALELGADFDINVEREVVLLNKDGERVSMDGQYGERNYSIKKKLSEIAKDVVTLPKEAGGVTLTGGQIALALEMLSDRYATEFREAEAKSGA